MKRRMTITRVLQVAAALLLTACDATVTSPKLTAEQPPIYPDYVGVTIPAEIAPMNFTLEPALTYDLMDVRARGSRGGEIHSQGKCADFDIDEWHSLTSKNTGGQITFSVCVRRDGEWTQFQDFTMEVSPNPLNDYGLTYRRIAPGYEVGNMGLYQRDLHTFREEAMVTQGALGDQCFNCHTANAADPSRVTMQIRGETGGTLIMKDGRQQWLNTRTDSTKMAGSYAYWHPGGDYIAYTAGLVEQCFFLGDGKPIEVYHRFGNIVVLDVRSNELLLDERLMTPDWVEIFPSFSADGRTLYYSTSRNVRLPYGYEDVKCSIVALPFDAATGTFGAEPDTLLNGPRDDASYVLARPSYDGRWLMYAKCSRSNFPIQQPDADLYIMNPATRETWPLTAANSPLSESYPNWSSCSHWIVFESKRENGQYTQLYISGIADDGHATKAFLLPQRDPWHYYHNLMDAYNVPDFTRTRVDFDVIEAKEKVLSGQRTPVTVREEK